jgi:subtilisin family serine protease
MRTRGRRSSPSALIPAVLALALASACALAVVLVAPASPAPPGTIRPQPPVSLAPGALGELPFEAAASDGFAAGAPLEAVLVAPDGGAGMANPQQASPTPLQQLGADVWQAAGFSGHGVKVAVLDTGFAGYRTRLGGSLPSTVVTRSFRADGDIEAGTDHGRRAAAIVHQVAPEAELYLVNFSTVSDLSRAVDYLIAERVDIVSFSLGFIHDGPGDGTGRVNAIVGRATDAGIAWAVAAGNWAEQHWGGFFRDFDGDSVHEFPVGQQVSHEFDAGDLLTASLRWDDEFGASCSDYDVELFGPSGALIAASRDVQDCDSDPVESIRVLATRTGAYSLRVVKAHDTQARRISLMVIGTPDRGEPLSQSTAVGSLSQPADHPAVITVGALSGALEAPFSSRGPTLDLRSKPDLLAPTALESGGFAGTSSAAPHVAGALALLAEAFPDATREGLTNQLQARSILLPPARGQTAGVRRAFLGTTAGLGPTLPAGASRSRILGLPQEAGIAVAFYQGPDGYPLRFLHLLANGRTATSVFRVLIPERTLQRHIPGAPDFVNEFDELNSGDLLFLRFDE